MKTELFPSSSTSTSLLGKRHNMLRYEHTMMIFMNLHVKHQGGRRLTLFLRQTTSSSSSVAQAPRYNVNVLKVCPIGSLQFTTHNPCIRILRAWFYYLVSSLVMLLVTPETIVLWNNHKNKRKCCDDLWNCTYATPPLLLFLHAPLLMWLGEA